MDTKKIVLVIVILFAAILSLSMVSAGWFDANQNDAGKNNTKPIPTKLEYDLLSANTTVRFKIGFNDSQSGYQYFDDIVYYNLTDEDGNVKSDNTTASVDNKVDIAEVTPGIDKEYFISAYFPGNDKYAPSSVNFTLTIYGSHLSSSGSGSSSGSSSDENPFADFHTDTSTSIDSIAQHDFSQ